MKTKLRLDKLKKYSQSIRGRILLSTLALILLVSTLVIFITYSILSEYIWQNMIQTSESRLSLLSASIDANVDNVMGFSYSCKTNQKTRSFLLNQEPSQHNKAKREAKDFISETYYANNLLHSQLIRLIIFTPEADEFLQLVESTYSSVAVSTDALETIPYFQLLLEHKNETYVGMMTDPFLYTRDVQMLPFVDIIEHPYNTDVIGYIYGEMSPHVITNPLYNVHRSTDSTFYVNIAGQLYQYSENTLLPIAEVFQNAEPLHAYSVDPDTSVQKVQSEEGNYILINRPIDLYDSYIMECISEDSVQKNIFESFLSIVALILLAAVFITILVAGFLNKIIYVPVLHLQNRMSRISDGDFSRDTSTEWNHELGEIGKKINDLAENVVSLMKQELENERVKKDYEYQMLQSQINPHFLYNTLNSIKWMATIQNAPGIAEMTTSLSRLLKDISKGTTNLVTIKHELDLIQDYFTIQKYRYGGTITLSIDVQDESILECSILKFTMQPLVENAIFHGIEPKLSAGTIVIHIYKENQDVHIDITDDGVGIDPETAKHLLDSNQATTSSFFKQIGVANVHKRLQYEYGDEYGLSITSEVGSYTTISIVLPAKIGDEK